jgi:hypothetical protein
MNETLEGNTDVDVKINVTPTVNFKAISINIIYNGPRSVQNSTLTRRMKLQT